MDVRINAFKPGDARWTAIKNVSKTVHELLPRIDYVIYNAICDSNTSILVYVHSAAYNFKKRLALRRTWANVTLFGSYGLKVAFFLGKSIPQNEKLLRRENEKYHDIIQGDFVESYRNLTYKAVFALSWMRKNCKQIKWIIKADDDMFLDMYAFLNYFQVVKSNASLSMLGFCKTKMSDRLIYRESNQSCDSKWCISDDYFPGLTHYPPHCLGSLTFITGDLLEHLYQATFKVQFFWVDDIYLTGMLMQEIAKGTVATVPGLLDVYGYYCLRRLGKKEKTPFMACKIPPGGENMLWESAIQYHLSKRPYVYSGPLYKDLHLN